MTRALNETNQTEERRYTDMSETGRQYFPEPTSTSVTASGAGAAPEEKKCTCPTKMWCGDEMNESTCVLTEEEHRALRSIPDEETCANCGKIYGEHLLWDGNKCEPGGVAGWFPSKVAHAIERSRLDFCACTGPGQCAAGSAKFRCRSDADIPYALAKQASSPAPVAPAGAENQGNVVINDTVTLYPIPGTNGDGWTDQPPVVAAEPVSEPLACPWCGLKGVPVNGANYPSWLVVCLNATCPAQPRTRITNTREEALALWNQRK